MYDPQTARAMPQNATRREPGPAEQAITHAAANAKELCDLVARVQRLRDGVFGATPQPTGGLDANETDASFFPQLARHQSEIGRELATLGSLVAEFEDRFAVRG